eukprot:gnl/MRDRNA2_/MRDRNA2_27264_c0_seq1.p1 gnl/MRDRNA2_/MRDRNA2_27264_c0~~gnl/MRDRNA2_/MRDRNA2_27264_c0_seq1.p1  ORF type:complete len:1647 (-),score=334.48 gnl/MRDRNA2_/MRDRNA2_27264_c0_seq1:12-4952(-)
MDNESQNGIYQTSTVLNFSAKLRAAVPPKSTSASGASAANRLTGSRPLSRRPSNTDEPGMSSLQGGVEADSESLHGSSSKVNKLGVKKLAGAVVSASRLKGNMFTKTPSTDEKEKFKKENGDSGEASENMESQVEKRSSQKPQLTPTQQQMRDLLKGTKPGQRTYAECASLAEAFVPLGHALFDAFGELACLQFMQDAIYLQYGKNESVFEMGNEGTDFFLVLSGSVWVGSGPSAGFYCGQGEFFGEGALTPGGGGRLMDATVHEGVSEIIAIPVDTFHEIANVGVINSDELRQELFRRTMDRGDSQASLRDRRLLLDVMKSSDDISTQKFVSDFDPSSLFMLRVLNRMTMRHVAKDDFVVRQDDEDDELFFVLSGKVCLETQVQVASKNFSRSYGHQKYTAAPSVRAKAASSNQSAKNTVTSQTQVVEPGFTFGAEVLDVSGMKRAYSARALEDTAMFVLRAPHFHEELGEWTTSHKKVVEIVRNLPPMKWTDKTLQALLDFARDTPFLQRHEPTVQKKILKSMRRRELKEETVLFQQGEVAESFFILLDGQMSVHWNKGTPAESRRNTLTGRQSRRSRSSRGSIDLNEIMSLSDLRNGGIQLSTLGPGATFGERSLQNREDYPFTAIAETPCELLELSRSAFEKLMGMTETVHQKAVEIIKSAPPVGHSGNRPRYRPKDLALLCTLVEGNANFGHMPLKTIQQMMNVAAYLHKPADRIIFREGDEGDMFYIVLSGKVGVYKEPPKEQNEQEKTAAEAQAAEAQKQKEKNRLKRVAGRITMATKASKLFGRKVQTGNEDKDALASPGASPPGSPGASPPASPRLLTRGGFKAGPRQSVLVTEGQESQASSTARRVSIDAPGEAEKRIKLVVLGPGAAFGERALLHGEPRAATLKTIEASEFLVLSKESFDAVLKEQMRAEMMRCATFLRQWLPGVKSLVESRVEKLATTCGKIKVLPRGKILINEGSRNEKVLWILVEGSWAVLVPSSKGTSDKGKSPDSRRVMNQTPVASVIASPGAIVGDISCMGLSEPATIRVTSATCEAYSIHWSDIVRHLPAAGIEVIKERGMRKLEWRCPGKLPEQLREHGLEASLPLALGGPENSSDKFLEPPASVGTGKGSAKDANIGPAKAKDKEGVKDLLQKYFHGQCHIADLWHDFFDAAMGCNARAGLDMSHSRILEDHTDKWRTSKYTGDVQAASELMLKKLSTVADQRDVPQQTKVVRSACAPPDISPARFRAEIMYVLNNDPNDAVQKVMRKIARLPTNNLAEWIKILMQEPRICNNDRIRAVIQKFETRERHQSQKSKGSHNTGSINVSTSVHHEASRDWSAGFGQGGASGVRPKSARAYIGKRDANFSIDRTDASFSRSLDCSMLIQTARTHDARAESKNSKHYTPEQTWKVSAQAEHAAAKERMADLMSVEEQIRVEAGLPPMSPKNIMSTERPIDTTGLGDNLATEMEDFGQQERSIRIPAVDVLSGHSSEADPHLADERRGDIEPLAEEAQDAVFDVEGGELVSFHDMCEEPPAARSITVPTTQEPSSPMRAVQPSVFPGPFSDATKQKAASSAGPSQRNAGSRPTSAGRQYSQLKSAEGPRVLVQKPTSPAGTKKDPKNEVTDEFCESIDVGPWQSPSPGPRSPSSSKRDWGIE